MSQRALKSGAREEREGTEPHIRQLQGVQLRQTGEAGRQQRTALYLANPQALDSLRFLSSGPITRSLKKLTLSYFRSTLPLRELAHVHALSSLTELMLFSVFDRPLDEYTCPSEHTPHSRPT
jgi:hypothetical protein